jgi:secondary thiamine-phosphate synthase enzyme
MIDVDRLDWQGFSQGRVDGQAFDFGEDKPAEPDGRDHAGGAVSRVGGGACVRGGGGFCAPPTAGVTINENADPDVVHDSLRQLDEMVPWRQPFYRHGEGNSVAHVKASMMGSSVMVMVENGRIELGTWQGIWFCEFDEPRTRTVWVWCLHDR